MIAPTGTIGLVMDCDTTGIEPDFALVKFKKLAGGGYFKIINRVGARRRSKRSATAEPQIDEIIALRRRPRHPRRRARHQPRDARRDKGFTRDALAKRRGEPRRRPSTSASSSTAGRWARTFCRESLGLTDAELDDSDFDLLRHLGFTREQSRRGQRLRLRHDDARGRAAPEGRAPAGLRLRQPLRPQRQALHLGREPHPHDGGGAAVHLRRDLARRSTCPTRRPSRTCQEAYVLSWQLGRQGHRALPRRLQAEPAARPSSLVEDDDEAEEIARDRRRPRDGARCWPRRSTERVVVSAIVAQAPRAAAASGARATPRRPSSAATRSTCAPASTRTARSARSSSTCTRRAPPSAA